MNNHFTQHRDAHVQQYSDSLHFGEIFSAEILLSERLRFTILAAIFGILMVGLLTVTTIWPEILVDLFKGKISRLNIVVAFGFLAVMNLGYRYLIGHFIKAKRPAPHFPRYINAAIEMSIPTLFIFYMAKIVGPDVAILTPPVFIYFLFLALSVLRLDPPLVLFAGMVGAVEYFLTASILLQHTGDSSLPYALTSMLHHIAKTDIIAVVGVVTSIVTWQLRQRIFATFKQIEEQNKIISVFGQQVSPQVVKKLLESGGQAQSETRDVCVMFLDIRGFTHYSEDKTPEHIVEYLNQLFDMTIDSVNHHGGIINKFLGDGFMAIFGAPIGGSNDCANATAAANEILIRADAMVTAGELPPTRLGMGLHYGPAVTGNIGSSARKEYTIIGDVVNLASRIETLNKTYQSQLLVSAAVAHELDNLPDNAKALGPVEIRGHEHPVEIYQFA